MKLKQIVILSGLLLAAAAQAEVRASQAWARFTVPGMNSGGVFMQSARSLEIVDLSFPETTALFKQRLEFASDSDQAILLEAANILGVDLG